MSIHAPRAPRALIAEDEPILAATLAHALQRLWPELDIVATSPNGVDAVQQGLVLRPDILFLDIKMPGKTGLEAAEELAEQWPADAPFPYIVFVTAYDEYALAAFEHAAADYVLKPVNDARLGKTVERLRQRLRDDAGDAASNAQGQAGTRAAHAAGTPGTPASTGNATADKANARHASDNNDNDNDSDNDSDSDSDNDNDSDSNDQTTHAGASRLASATAANVTLATPDAAQEAAHAAQAVLAAHAANNQAHAANDVKLAHLLAQLQSMVPPAPRLQMIRAAVGNSVRMIALADVVYFEALDKYINVVCRDSEALIRTSLKELLPQLDPEQFWQIHRSTIVNASAIASAVRDEAGKLSLTLRQHGAQLRVSPLYAHLFRQM